MKQAHPQAEKPAVSVTADSGKVQMGAMTPSFPPAKLSPESKECEKGR